MLIAMSQDLGFEQQIRAGDYIGRLCDPDTGCGLGADPEKVGTVVGNVAKDVNALLGLFKKEKSKSRSKSKSQPKDATGSSSSTSQTSDLQQSGVQSQPEAQWGDPKTWGATQYLVVGGGLLALIVAGVMIYKKGKK